MKTITLNEGSQKDFVGTEDRYSAYIGGLGSGKTFAGIVRGLKMAQQPKPEGALYGARGCIAAINYPVLRDVVLPQFYEIVEGTGLLKKFWQRDMKAELTNGAEILFRSLDEPNKLRGIEISWFFIDEGRHVTKESWDILIGRLRQKGFNHAGWVCSTPNGYDWMWQIFHHESPYHWEHAQWYGAPTYENARNLPAEYMKDLEASYEGKFYRQEVLGEFIGVMHGAVFPSWDMVNHMPDVRYNPHLPLYSFWDFGVGDLGICLFAQIDWQSKTLPSGGTEFVPVLKFIGEIEGGGWNAAEWARQWKQWLTNNTGGRYPDSSWGDPAGRQRTHVSGTSMIDALRAEGVPVNPAPKRPLDYGVIILNNMMEGGRVLADKTNCRRLGAALATHKWNVDDQGNKLGTNPVADWTKHFCDSARYGAQSLLAHEPRRTSPPPQQISPGTWAFVEQQLNRPRGNWLGPQEDELLQWHPTTKILDGYGGL